MSKLSFPHGMTLEEWRIAMTLMQMCTSPYDFDRHRISLCAKRHIARKHKKYGMQVRVAAHDVEKPMKIALEYCRVKLDKNKCNIDFFFNPSFKDYIRLAEKKVNWRN